MVAETSFLKKACIILIIASFYSTGIFSQGVQIAFSTDVSIARSLKKDQQFWAIGQTVRFDGNASSRQSVYISLSYYSNGKFKNDLVATAKSAITSPKEIAYQNNALLKLKYVSIGTRYFFKGRYDAEEGLNVYGIAGLGITLATVENSNSFMDTTRYLQPVATGKGNFKRLTFDLGLGLEQALGGDLYLYGEGTIQLPSSGYPSKYLLVNKNAPLPVFLNLGFRLLFGYL